MKFVMEGGKRIMLILCAWLFLHTGLCYAETYNLTVYQSNEVSWFDAEMFCENEGARLIKINDDTKHSSFLEFVRKFGYDSQIYPHDYWTGMHSTNNNNCGKYYWADCEDNIFSNWKPSTPEPDNCGTHKCVRMNEYYYLTTDCDSHRRFICEKVSTKSSFETFINTDVPTTGWNSIALDNMELSECLEVCSNAIFGSLNCWVVIVNDYDVKCKLLFTNDAYIVDTTSYSTSGTHLHVRRRFEVNIISDSVSFDGIFGLASTCPIVRPLPTTVAITTEQTTTAPDQTTPNVQCTTLKTTTEATTSPPNPTTTMTTPTTTTPTTTTASPNTTTASPTTTTSSITATTTQQQTTTFTTVRSTLSDIQLQEKLTSLVTETKVDTKSTNADARKKTCAEDTRTSSQSIGLIATGMLVAILAAIVLADIPTFLKDAGIHICTPCYRK